MDQAGAAVVCCDAREMCLTVAVETRTVVGEADCRKAGGRLPVGEGECRSHLAWVGVLSN
jgi:hypothetical protein